MFVIICDDLFNLEEHKYGCYPPRTTAVNGYY